MIYIYLILGLLIILYYFYGFQKRNSIPKGLKETPIEYGLPILGIIHKIKEPMHNYLLKLSKKHGPIFRIKLGMRDVLILSNYDIIKKALVDDGQNFSGRWRMKLISLITHDSGIIFKDGQDWSTQRSFVLKVLRDFGLGKSKSVDLVQNECSFLLEELESLEGKIIDFSKIIPIYTANIISKFIMNKRFERENPKIARIEKMLSEEIKKKDIIQLLHIMFPKCDTSGLFCELIINFTSKWKEFLEIQNYFKEEIDEHLKTIDFNSEGEDLMDRFLIKQNQLKQQNIDVGSFNDWQLIRSSLELFYAGYETTSTTLCWSFLFMSKHQDIQQKVHNEIIEIIGKERLPTMNDKKSMNYTQAVMDEIFRMSSVAPLALIHRTLNDANIDGYFIPKNTLIFPNLYACHFDRDIWEKPMIFYPEHFLTEDDNGNLKYTPRDELILFSIGKRQCLGESLARMEFFIFFTSILQRFRVKLVKELNEKEYEEALLGKDGIIRGSIVNDFIFTKQN
uniref:P450 2B-like protein n=1 Tax=Dugesia japonica TaxID=6161 RepID=A0A4P8NYX5_DUGJA|nr:P450 2B-like protein [Dugesia japonica]